MANVKTLLRMKKAATMVALGLPDAAIAAHIGVTPAGLATMKQQQEFKVIQNQIASGVMSDYEQELLEDTQNAKDMIKTLVPPAIQALAACVQQNLDMKLKLAAGSEILDRHGVFVKASRTQTPQETEVATFISSKDDSVAAQLAQALPPPATQPVEKKETIQ